MTIHYVPLYLITKLWIDPWPNRSPNLQWELCHPQLEVHGSWSHGTRLQKYPLNQTWIDIMISPRSARKKAKSGPLNFITLWGPFQTWWYLHNRFQHAWLTILPDTSDSQLPSYGRVAWQSRIRPVVRSSACYVLGQNAFAPVKKSQGIVKVLRCNQARHQYWYGFGHLNTENDNGLWDFFRTLFPTSPLANTGQGRLRAIQSCLADWFWVDTWCDNSKPFWNSQMLPKHGQLFGALNVAKRRNSTFTERLLRTIQIEVVSWDLNASIFCQRQRAGQRFVPTDWGYDIPAIGGMIFVVRYAHAIVTSIVKHPMINYLGNFEFWGSLYIILD